MKTNKNLGSGALWYIKVTYIVTVGALMTAFLTHNKEVAFNFYWNPYIIPPLCLLLSIPPIIFVLNLPKNRNRLTFWFSIYLASSVIWQIGEVTKLLSADVVTYNFWHYMTFPISASFTGPLLLLFVFVYIEKEDLMFRFSNWAMLFGGSLFGFFLALQPGLTHLPLKTLQRFYGFPVSPALAPWGGVYTLLTISVIVTANVLLIRYYLSLAKGSVKRKQARLFVIGISLPIILGSISDGVLPALHLRVIPLDFVANSVSVVLVAYALLHYRLFEIDPATLSSTVLTTMNEAVITVNRDYEVENLNSASLNLLASHTTMSRGQSLEGLFGQENAGKIVAKLKEDKNNALDFHITVDEQALPISLVSSKLLRNDDAIVGYVLVFRDMTKERLVISEIENLVAQRTKELDKEKNTLQTLIDSLPVGVFVAKASTGQPILMNSTGIQIAGHTFDPKIHSGQYADVYDIVREDGRPYPSDHLPLEITIKKQKPAEASDVYLLKPDGKKVALRVLSAPIKGPDGTIESAVVVFEDITEAKLMERSKDEFFSIASHELRTPLTSIRGNTSMILDYYKKALKDKDLKDMIQDVHISSIRLIEIVNDFLDVSRLEQRKISFSCTPVSVGKIIKNVTYEMKADLEKNKLYLHMDKLALESLPLAWVDENRLKQVIFNIVGNSAKFTETGGITISTELDAKKAFIKVFVSDTGRGIAVESQQLLFHKFQQASSSLLTRDATRGTGLGLYISKMIIESMGGQIVLERSEPKKGSVFSFTLPVATAKQRATPLTPQTPKSTIDSATGLTKTPKTSK